MTADIEIPVVLMRGGTSKGVFVRDGDLPSPGPERDRLVLALMGSPDAMQIDGLGGTHSSTSKLMAIAPSHRDGCDVEYTFCQVGIERAVVDVRGNCGNLTAAVGAYAVDEGYISLVEPVTIVRLYNRNTGTIILAHVPVAGGKALSQGTYAIDGVPGTGAPILTEYLDPAGAVTGALFPSGHRRQLLHPRVGTAVEVSIVDVTAPVVLVTADALGIDPCVSPAELNASSTWLERLESIRGAAAVAAGMARNEDDALATSAAVPRVAIVSPPAAAAGSAGVDIDVVVRATSLQRAHHAIPLTTAMCVAAACRLPGTVAPESRGDVVNVAHPKGTADVTVRLDVRGDAVVGVGVTRTARRLLAGTAFVRVPPAN